jgi:hypothetical protein
MDKRSSKHMDMNQLAKSILDEATGDAQKHNESAKLIATRSSGKKGGPARAAALTPEQRSEIARLAATARWKKKN